MRVEQQLVEQYWGAVFAGDVDVLGRIVDKNIRVTLDTGSTPTVTFKNCNELFGAVKKVVSLVQQIQFFQRSYEFLEGEVRVVYSQMLELDSKEFVHSFGHQVWFIKEGEAGAKVLGALHMEEKSNQLDFGPLLQTSTLS